MGDSFLVLRSTPDGPAFLARPDQIDDIHTWTTDYDEARQFSDRTDAADVQADIVARLGIAVAVVPDYIKQFMTARATRVGPGPDRPMVHR